VTNSICEELGQRYVSDWLFKQGVIYVAMCGALKAHLNLVGQFRTDYEFPSLFAKFPLLFSHEPRRTHHRTWIALHVTQR